MSKWTPLVASGTHRSTCGSTRDSSLNSTHWPFGFMLCFRGGRVASAIIFSPIINNSRPGPIFIRGPRPKCPRLLKPSLPPDAMALNPARMARVDLLRAVCNLACFVTKWTSECDRKLHRLICYIAASKHHRQIGWIGDKPSDLAPHLFADADFAGYKVTMRSTGGGHLAIMGPNSCSPQAGK